MGKLNEKTSPWFKKQKERIRRLRIIGWTLLLTAFILCSFAFLADMEIFSSVVEMTADEQEGYFMMSVVFGVMGLFCLNAVRYRN